MATDAPVTVYAIPADCIDPQGAGKRFWDDLNGVGPQLDARGRARAQRHAMECGPCCQQALEASRPVLEASMAALAAKK